MIDKVRTRLRQGVLALWSRRLPSPLPPRYRAAVPGEVAEAWKRLSPYDQHHLIAVADDLAARGAGEALALAGLLHDIGKAGRVTIIDRVLLVLLRRFAPALLHRLERRECPIPGLEGLHLLVRHAEAGACLLERAGMPDETVRLVRLHESVTDDPAVRALKQADHHH